jgi:putative two-component system response regulator
MEGVMALEAHNATVLIVDDVPSNIHVLGSLLSRDYVVKVATDGIQALRSTMSEPRPDLILLDVMMPDMDGYEVLRQLKDHPVTRQIPVIFVTAKGEIDDETRGFDLGAADYITKPIVPRIVEARVRTHLALHDQHRDLENRVRQRTQELDESRLHLIACLGRAANYRDNETGLHVQRVGRSAYELALRAGMAVAEAELLLYAAPLHDIGKIGIPDPILFKTSKQDPEEWRIMQTHVEIGARIIGDVPSDLLQMARTVALTHHERWDGAGYPHRLTGEQIPLVGRIVALADVFDALTSERPYKRAWPAEEAFALIRQESGRQFEPRLVTLFLEMDAELRMIRRKFQDDEPPV